MYIAHIICVPTLFSCRYISGSMHYSRVQPYYWKDRLEKLYAAGLNAVQTYVPWNFHEARPGNFDFDGDKDLVKFIQMAQEVGLLVILRAGPYICAEWDMGGLPSWLLREKSIALRTSDPTYLAYVDKWMSVLLPKMNPLLYENGGPIITVQVENEYGSYYACDKDYLKHLEETFRKHLGPNVVLFTTDGASDSYLKCGTLPSLYSTVDFGITSNPEEEFKAQRDYEPRGPLVNSEFYTGWLDYWGHPHQRRNSTQVAETLNAMLMLNASVNMYMFEGGTNFGFWNGADAPSDYLPVPTSYDYDAPLTEAGDPWEKFTLIRNTISKFKHVPSHVPGPTPKAAYGKVQMTEYASLFACPELIMKNVTADNPVTMEELGQDFGFVIYRSMPIPVTDLAPNRPGLNLTLYGLHDRAAVFVNSILQGILTRTDAKSSVESVNVSSVAIEMVVEIVVENMGRISYGSLINDSKGILNDITLGGRLLKKWISQSVAMNDTSKILFHPLNESQPPTFELSVSFFRGTFSVEDQPQDTFLNVTGWTKGQAFVNGFNLGRYWPAKGPQKTLYVPANLLKMKTNELILFEIDQAPCKSPFTDCYASFVDTPNIG